MITLTENEARVMDFLVRNIKERNSINQVAKKLRLSPNGAYKILKKLEKANAIMPEKIGNAVYYKVNYNDEIGKKLAEVVLVQNDLNNYAKVQADDLRQLKGYALSGILFGSVLKKGKEANDIDVLLVLESGKFREINKRLEEIKERKPKKMHDIMMTKEDLAKNIRKGDEVTLSIIKTGKVLWGFETIVEACKNASY
ncbi:MAG TPA: helix-turn-helix domain-containing protein [Candidatus Nanoarchaeia archaeon]|nr:helix-turn-helix domain-containing protein [Candidatus Nanoarchaeia archaeon]